MSSTPQQTESLKRQLDVAREFTQRLSDKVQQQAKELQQQSEQLQHLAGYSKLCEKRLLQAVPPSPCQRSG